MKKIMPIMIFILMGCNQQELKIDEVKDLLSEADNLKIKKMGGKIILDGYTLNSLVLNKVKKLENAYPGTVVSLVGLNNEGSKELAKKMEAEISNPDIYVSVVNGVFLLEGAESYAGERKRAYQIAEVFLSGLTKTTQPMKADEEKSCLNTKKIVNNIATYRGPIAPLKKNK